ncbi:MAG: hypothetical protein KAI16_01870 [Candidatus Pacebacteria bacterium]|nr:hypothetical protein [Candidatus Paceibacterota bacterium]
MTEDLKKVLEKLNILSKKIDDNIKITRDLRSYNRWGFFFKILYWGFLIAMACGTWYLVQPMMDSIGSTIETISQTGSNISDSLDSFKKVGESVDELNKNISEPAGDIKDLINNFVK